MSKTEQIGVLGGGIPHPLTSLFRPAAVAVVGASRDPGKWGNVIMQNLQQDGFPGRVYPINPKGGEVLGYPVYPAVSAVPGPVDLAVIGVRREAVAPAVQDCARAGVKVAVIITGGFAEWDEGGRAVQDQIVRTAREAGMRVVGPNCYGVFSAASQLNLTASRGIRRGPLGFVSQSGNMGVALFEEGEQRGLGFSAYVGVGNQSDIAFHEYVEYLGEDPDLKVILLYIEGLREGRSFVEVARRITPVKPIVALKGGRTAGGGRLTASHTGSLAGDERAFRAAMLEAGVITVERSDELFTIAEALCYQPVPTGARVASVTDGGGHAVLFADACERGGVPVAIIAPDLADKLAKELPARASPHTNPVDTAGGMDFDPQMLARCVEPMLDHPDVDAMIVTGIFGGYRYIFSADLEAEEIATAQRLIAAQRRTGKPLLVHTTYAWRQPQCLKMLREAGIPVSGSLEGVIAAFKALYDYGAAQRRLAGPRDRPELAAVPRLPAGAGGPLPGHHAFSLLAEMGLPAPPVCLVHSADEAMAAAERVGYPVVLKVESRDVLHKTDAGGVLVGLNSKGAVADGYATVMENVRRRKPGARVDGVLLMPQAPPGLEVIVGVVRDPQFGPMVMAGMGGIYVEVLKDVAFRLAPVSPAAALEMLRELRLFPVLTGLRGQSGVDLDALATVVARVSVLAAAHPEIAEVDLNPVFAYPRGAAIVDARIIVQ